MLIIFYYLYLLKICYNHANMMKPTNIFLLAFCVLSLISNQYTAAQFNRTKNWVLGDSLAIDFSNATPTVGFSSLNSLEGISAISDTNGNLLLYTNGITVWNAQHQVMPNGTGLFANLSTSNAALIVPMPAHADLYYIFVMSAFATPGALTYSIVDMSLDGGLGDITVKNEYVFGNSTEKLCATMHANGIDYWIMTHDYGNNTFRAYLLTSQGLDTTAVISKIGEAHTYGKGQGSMRFSPSGCRLALAKLLKDISGHVEVFNFDNATGNVFNPMGLYVTDPVFLTLFPLAGLEYITPYTLCFSPDNSKLYVSSLNFLVQFDLEAGEEQDIQQSSGAIASVWNVSSYNDYFGDLQIAPNGKIYVSRMYAQYISVINNPNGTGSSCDFDHNVLYLGSYVVQTKGKYGLPNFVSNFLIPDHIAAETCPQPEVIDTFFLQIPNVFTPNGDGQNDVFSIQQQGVQEVNFVIYNRWGNIVHQMQTFPTQKDVLIWNGGNASDGTYFYTATLIDMQNNTHARKGFIQLFR